MKTILSLLILASITTCQPAVAGDYKYNTFSGEYEYANRGEELRYNPYNDEYTYESKSAEIEYNPYSNTYSYENNTDDE